MEVTMHASPERQAWFDETDVASDAGVGREDWYGAMTAQVAAFLARLRRVPADAWYRAATEDGHIVASATLAPAVLRRREVREDEAARARLRQVMDSMPAVARRIRRRIDEELTVLDGIATVSTLTQMRRAARIAACAVAARPFISDADFERLYRPFERLVPTEELAAH
jgi:hypothetical protein